MKHLKKYENNRVYWILPTQPKLFKKALKEIGWKHIPGQQDFLSNDNLPKKPYVFISREGISDFNWCWMNDIKSSIIKPNSIEDIKSPYYEKTYYTFLGPVNMPDLEILIDTNKYNL